MDFQQMSPEDNGPDPAQKDGKERSQQQPETDTYDELLENQFISEGCPNCQNT